MPESEAAAIEPKGVDAGLSSLCIDARFLGIRAAHRELARRHLVSSSSASAQDLVRTDGKAPMQRPPEPCGGPVARISLDETAIETERGRVTLEPGMTVSAGMKTGERRLISSLLSPFMHYRHEALRER